MGKSFTLHGAMVGIRRKERKRGNLHLFYTFRTLPDGNDLMKLPHLDRLVVEQAKVTDYLLSATHRYGASKARFFVRFGFRTEDWQVLAGALLDHARRHEIKRMRETGFGPVMKLRRIFRRRTAGVREFAPFGNRTTGRLRHGSSLRILWRQAYD